MKINWKERPKKNGRNRINFIRSLALTVILTYTVGIEQRNINKN